MQTQLKPLKGDTNVRYTCATCGDNQVFLGVDLGFHLKSGTPCVVCGGVLWKRPDKVQHQHTRGLWSPIQRSTSLRPRSFYKGVS